MAQKALQKAYSKHTLAQITQWDSQKDFKKSPESVHFLCTFPYWDKCPKICHVKFGAFHDFVEVQSQLESPKVDLNRINMKSDFKNFELTLEYFMDT